MDLLNIESAVIPVTGAAAGIGLAICKLLREAGATPLLLDLNQDRLDSAVREIYGSASDAKKWGYVVNVADSQAVDRCLADIRKDHGPVTHAVANAGIMLPGSILDVTDEQWHQVMNVNLHGVMYFARAVARQLVENKRGALVLMASLAGFSAKRNRISYVTSKAAVVNLTRSLALDLGEHGIRVNGVAPGYVNTAMQQSKSPEFLKTMVEPVPLGRMAEPEEIAKVALFLLSDMSSYVSGETILTDGGLTASYA